MSRKRPEVNNVRISDEEYGRLENKYDLLRNEFSACKRKLDSKCEALLILSQELDQCRSERDQFKLMAEQLRERYQSLKKQMSTPVGLSATDKQAYRQYCGTQGENVGKLLYESRELVKSQQFEIDDLKQKLNDAQGDIKLLREQIARQRVGTTDEGMNTRHFPAHEREDLVRQLEASREEMGISNPKDDCAERNRGYSLCSAQHGHHEDWKRPSTTELHIGFFFLHNSTEKLKRIYVVCLGENTRYLQLERDLQTVLDEKQEFVTERDAYKTKYDRLNQELNYILRGDEKRIVDIDALVMENKYLQDRLKQMEEEKTMAMAAVSKYKSLLEKRKTKSCIKLGQSRGGGMVITQKEVHKVLESQGHLMPTPQAMADLQALAGALLDSVNDKNLALSHQRKTNKILGNRVAELEKKLKTLEVAGLWNVPAAISASLEKLKSECEDVKTMIPFRQNSETSELSASTEADNSSDLGTVSPLDSTLVSPETSPTHGTVSRSYDGVGHGKLGHLELEDLDLLPTKEVSVKAPCIDKTEQTLDKTHHDDLYSQQNKPNHLRSISKALTPPANSSVMNIPDHFENSDHSTDEHGTDLGKEGTDIETSDKNNDIHNVDNASVAQQEPKYFAHKHEAKSLNDSQQNLLYKSPSQNIDDQDDEVTVTVYNADKVTETDESDVVDDLSDNFISENKAEIDTFYGDNKPDKLIDTGDTDNEKEESVEESERMGLLMENATQKMRTMSQHLNVSDDETSAHVTDRVDEESCSKVVLNQENNSLKCPLMQDQEHSEPDPEDLRNVEC